AKRGQIRNKADEPEQQRNGTVGGNCKNVPDERAAKLRPEPHRAGIREHVEGHPRAPGMNQREDAGAGDGEGRHGFREPVDRGTPLLMQRNKIAEMSVPAWPIPIHQTKFTMAKPQATGMSMPQMPTPLVNSQPMAMVIKAVKPNAIV